MARNLYRCLGSYHNGEYWPYEMSHVETRTPEQIAANLARVKAWYRVWHSLAKAQQDAWQRLSRPEKDATKKMTAQEFAEVMNPNHRPSEETTKMEWIKTKVYRWTANDYRITEAPDEPNGRVFRLDGPDSDPEYFATLNDAKANASLKNELALFKEDNEQLRAELAERKDADHFERRPPKRLSDDDAQAHAEAQMGCDAADEHDAAERRREQMESISGDLNEVIAANSRAATLKF